MLSETLKSLRGRAKLSQEQLAEKLHVSRQAITKWETGAGLPDIENLRAISALFRVSLDELLENQSAEIAQPDFLFDSLTFYDIDRPKDYDITFIGAKKLVLSGYDGEQIQVRLASNQIPNIQSVFKVRIDDVKERIDVDARRAGDITEAEARDGLFAFIRLPRRYVKTIELSVHTEFLELRGIGAERLELSGGASRVLLDGVSGHVELDGKGDMEILCGSLDGRIDVNQISCVSRLSLPAGTAFSAAAGGSSNRISYQRDGADAPDFSLKGGEAAACANRIELNGMKSELIINASANPLAGE